MEVNDVTIYLAAGACSTHVTTPDHCSSYALSDPKDQAFRSDCAHSHEDRCLSFEVLKSALKQIRNAVAES